jgi:DNA (cytosine-5)-methyltransferase 1
VVNSLAFVPQRRERVLFIATTTEIDPAHVLLADEAVPQIPGTDLSGQAHGFYWTEGTRGLGWAPDAVPTLKNGSSVGIPSPPAIMLPCGSIITPDIRDAERLQGFDEDWTSSAAAVGRASLRWSLVGNAVTVPVARWLGERLLGPGSYDTERDVPLGAVGGWPKAARYDGTKRWAVQINAYPTWCNREPLHRFLRYPGKPLSARATRGFLSRTEQSTLRFAAGFQDRLRDHLRMMESSSRSVLEYAVAAE